MCSYDATFTQLCTNGQTTSEVRSVSTQSWNHQGQETREEGAERTIELWDDYANLTDEVQKPFILWRGLRETNSCLGLEQRISFLNKCKSSHGCKLNKRRERWNRAREDYNDRGKHKIFRPFLKYRRLKNLVWSEDYFFLGWIGVVWWRGGYGFLFAYCLYWFTNSVYISLYGRTF